MPSNADYAASTPPAYPGALLPRAQDRLFGATDTVCLERAQLITAAYQEHADEPVPVRRALAFAHVLAHLSLDLDSNPVFAGNTSARPRAWMLIPEHGLAVDAQVALEHEELRGFLDDQVPADLREYWAGKAFSGTAGGPGGIGHLAVDLDVVVHRGLAWTIAEIEAGDSASRDAAARNYRRAMAIGCRAVIRWAERYAEAAQTAAETANDPLLGQAHQRVAAACRRVPAQPARDLFEALQAIVLVHLAIFLEGHGMSVSLGLLDRVLAPFAAEVETDFETARDLLSAFLLKIAAVSYQGRGSKTQPVTVGGADAAGGDCCNAVTRACLAAFDQTPVSDPHLFLRWHPGLDPGVMAQAVDMLARGRSMPLLVNDGPTVTGFVASGIAPRDAAEYCVIGCNELGIPGRMMSAAHSTGQGLNFLGLLCDTLRTDAAAELGSSEAVLGLMERTLLPRVREGVARRRAQLAAMAAQVPTPFTSALMAGARERHRDLVLEMAYSQPGFFERGLVDAANALASLEAVVFGAEGIGLSALRAALAADFPDEALRQRLRAAPHWGNDDARADRWVPALLDMRERCLRQVEAQLGLPRHMPCHVVRSLHHLDGRHLPASPDGRRAGEPVGDSVGGVVGTLRSGPTAMLRSVLKLSAARYYPGGTNLNLTLCGSDRQPEVIRGLAEGFFREGGQELQVNCLEAAKLRDARERPDLYRDLVVRVAGLSARFVELSLLEQAELIARAEAAE